MQLVVQGHRTIMQTLLGSDRGCFWSVLQPPFCQGRSGASVISSRSLVPLIRLTEAAGSHRTSLGGLSFLDVCFVRRVDFSMHFHLSVRSFNELYIPMCTTARFSFAKPLKTAALPSPD